MFSRRSFCTKRHAGITPCGNKQVYHQYSGNGRHRLITPNSNAEDMESNQDREQRLVKQDQIKVACAVRLFMRVPFLWW